MRRCTVDYAQNTMMPHIGDKQPGETHCCLYVNVCTLGALHCGMQPMTSLCAHVCFEDEGKKGGNNAASLIHRQLFCDGFLIVDKKHTRQGDCLSVWQLWMTEQEPNGTSNAAPSGEEKRGVSDVARAIFSPNATPRMIVTEESKYHRAGEHPDKTTCTVSTRTNASSCSG